MKHYYIDLGNKRMNLKPEQVDKVFKALDSKEARFIEVNDEKIQINFIKGIFRDYEKEDLEERSDRIKKEIEGWKENKETIEKLVEMKKDFGSIK